MTKINNVHDKFFKTAMSDLHVAKEFMQQHLPAPVLSATDLSTLTLQKESFIEQDLQQMLSDVLYQAKINGTDGYIYLLAEHQSTPDRLMAFRLLRYTCRIMAHHIEHLKHCTLPVVVPLVFYHGKRIYSHSTDIFDLFGNSRALAESTLLQPFNLIDANTIPDEELKQQVWSGVLTFMQKHIHTRNLLQCIHELMPLFKKLMTLEAEHYIISTMEYAIKAGNIDSIEELAKLTNELSPELEGKVMTLAERLEAKGKAAGMSEGMAAGMTTGQAEATRRVAASMLSRGFEANLVSEVTGLSIEIVHSLPATEKETQ